MKKYDLLKPLPHQGFSVFNFFMQLIFFEHKFVRASGNAVFIAASRSPGGQKNF